MPTTWTPVSVADVTGIGTTEKFTAAIAVAPNEALSIDAQLSAHGTNSITITAYASNDGGTKWAAVQAVEVPAGDVDPRALGPFILRPSVRLGFRASGSTDLPTATIRAVRGPLNAA